MESYFLALELPGTQLKYSVTKNNPQIFWANALTTINNGNSKIVSFRQDTGVSEELQDHKRDGKKFKTYLLLSVVLDNIEKNDSAIALQKAANLLKVDSEMILIDHDDKFQLITNIN